MGKINKGAAKILKRVCYQSPQTLIHADYRADNLIMLPGEDCAVLDWQLCSTGPGVYDLVDDLWADYGYALLAHACLVFAIGLDGIGADGDLVADWKCFELCKVMFERLARAILDFG